MTLLDERPTTSFAAPRSVFAPAPPERRGVARDRVRLLVADGDRGLTHTRFTHLPEHLRPGDVVVVNDSATVAAQLDAQLVGGHRSGPVVVHLAAPLPDGSWVVEVRRAPDADRAVLDADAGDVLEIAAGAASLRLVAPYPEPGSSPTGTGNRLWRAEAAGDLPATARRYGRPISYGYLADRYPLGDYQTVFGHRPGSAEIPSAGRPFTSELVTRLVAGGVVVAPVTLHTGVSSQEAGEAPQPERFEVSATTAAVVNAARAGGGRVVAVGTTVTRALESAVEGSPDDARLAAARGWTSRVVTPQDPPRIVDGLITGWHDPEASHLLLVEAVAGRDLTQRAYAAAVDAHYLWHEFGDSALLLPAAG